MGFVRYAIRRFTVCVLLVLALGLVAVRGGGVSAQDDAQDTPACEIDVSEAVALLVKAQAAASGGNMAEAQDLIADAQAELEAIAACENIPRFALSENYEYSDGRSFRFSYPEGWATALPANDEYIVSYAPTQALAESEFFYQTDPPALNTGEYTGMTALYTPREFGIFNLTGSTPTALEFAEGLRIGLLELDTISDAAPVEAVEVDGREVQLATIYGEGYAFVIAVEQVDQIEATFEVPENLFLFVAVAGAPDEIDIVRQLALDIMDSAEYTPDTQG